MSKLRSIFIYKITKIFVFTVFTAFVLTNSPFFEDNVFAQASFSLPRPGVMVLASPAFNPLILKGLKVHPDNPFKLDFILGLGDASKGLEEGDLKRQSTRLIKYFLTSLTIPKEDLWVNLSPYEKNKIIPNSFGLTEMGCDLLAEDYMLKQITASMIYPEEGTGKKFWKRIYEEARKKYGTVNIPVNTFNKVWIVPEKAAIYENAAAGVVYVVDSKLKVMLEEDYLSLKKHQTSRVSVKGTSTLGSQILREIVIPELTREVNHDKNFAQLRQVYNSLILATWYKNKIQDSMLNMAYSDQNKISALNGHSSSLTPEKIYQRYVQAFKKGVFNYIKEESAADPDQQSEKQGVFPRKYFSGGFSLESVQKAMISVPDVSQGERQSQDFAMAEADLTPAGEPSQVTGAELIQAYIDNPATDPQLLEWLKENQKILKGDDPGEFWNDYGNWLNERGKISRKKFSVTVDNREQVLLRLFDRGILKREELPRIWLDNLRKLQPGEELSEDKWIARVQTETGFDDINELMEDLASNGYVEAEHEGGTTLYRLTYKFVALTPRSVFESHKFDSKKMALIYNYIHFRSAYFIPDYFQITNFDITEEQLGQVLNGVADEKDIAAVWGLIKDSVPSHQLTSQIIAIAESLNDAITIARVARFYKSDALQAAIAIGGLAMNGDDYAKRVLNRVYSSNPQAASSFVHTPEDLGRLIEGLVEQKSSEQVSFTLGVIVADNPTFAHLVPDHSQDIMAAVNRGSISAISYLVKNAQLFEGVNERAKSIVEAKVEIDKIREKFNELIGDQNIYYDTNWVPNFRNFLFNPNMGSPIDHLSLKDLLNALQSAFDIYRPYFWSSSLRNKIFASRYANDLDALKPGERTAIVIYPKNDPTGVYMSERRIEHLNEHFTVLYYEAETAEDVAAALKNGTQYGKASVVVIGDRILTPDNINVLQEAGVNNVLKSRATAIIEVDKPGLDEGLAVAQGLAVALGRTVLSSKPSPMGTSYFYSNGYERVTHFLPGTPYFRATPRSNRPKLGQLFRSKVLGSQPSVRIKLAEGEMNEASIKSRIEHLRASRLIPSGVTLSSVRNGDLHGLKVQMAFNTGEGFADKVYAAGIADFGVYDENGSRNIYVIVKSVSGEENFYRFRVDQGNVIMGNLGQNNSLNFVKVPMTSPEVLRIRENKNQAMIGSSHSDLGGIDLSLMKGLLEQQRSSSNQGIRFHIDPAMLNRFRSAKGLIPIITQIQMKVDLDAFLEV